MQRGQSVRQSLPLKGKALAQSWNGKLPTVMTGEGSSMIPVLDVNQLSETDTN